MAASLVRRAAINLAVEVIGDRWSLIMVRNIKFGERRSYRELLMHSDEGIASNILASRLKRLVSEQMLTVAAVPGQRQCTRYSLTERAPAPSRRPNAHGC